MLQDDELAILGDYNSGNNDGYVQPQPADLATKDIIIEYDEYEKQLMREICGMEANLGKDPLEVQNAQKGEESEMNQPGGLNEAI